MKAQTQENCIPTTEIETKSHVIILIIVVMKMVMKVKVMIMAIRMVIIMMVKMNIISIMIMMIIITIIRWILTIHLPQKAYDKNNRNDESHAMKTIT